jgi:hypothetical protein
MYNDFKELLSALNAHRVRYLIKRIERSSAPAPDRSHDKNEFTRDADKGIDDDIET